MASYSSDQQVAHATADAQMVPLGQRARITGIQASTKLTVTLGTIADVTFYFG